MTDWKILIVIIAMSVVALVLLGVILFCVLRRKKRAASKAAAAPVAEQTAKETVQEAVEETVKETVEEPVEEPVKEEPIKEEPAPEAPAEAKPEVVETDEKDEEEVAESDGADDEVTRVMPVEENGRTRFIVIKYSKSFLARLIQSDGQTKRYYSELKNKLLSYDGVKNRITWKYESFRTGRKTLAKLRVRGKTLSVTLALDPADYADTKYRVESLAEIKSYATTPCKYRIKNDRRLAYAKELIGELATKNGLIEKADAENIDYAAIPYEETDALIARKLIKVLTDEDAQSGTAFKPSEVRESVTAKEVDTLMKDEVAASLIVKSDGKTDKTKQGIINIDLLSQYFESGEMVTLDEVKKRVKGFDKRTTYLKVLARGTLSKPLTVEADSFSLQAVKMIVLTGGKAIKNSK